MCVEVDQQMLTSLKPRLSVPHFVLQFSSKAIKQNPEYKAWVLRLSLNVNAKCQRYNTNSMYDQLMITRLHNYATSFSLVPRPHFLRPTWPGYEIVPPYLLSHTASKEPGTELYLNPL